MTISSEGRRFGCGESCDGVVDTNPEKARLFEISGRKISIFPCPDCGRYHDKHGIPVVACGFKKLVLSEGHIKLLPLELYERREYLNKLIDQFENPDGIDCADVTERLREIREELASASRIGHAQGCDRHVGECACGYSHLRSWLREHPEN